MGTRGLVGSWERSRSRSFISDTASGDRPGVKLGMLPRGMYFLDAVRRIWRKGASPDPQEKGRPATENRSSVSRVKHSQSAFLKLVKV